MRVFSTIAMLVVTCSFVVASGLVAAIFSKTTGGWAVVLAAFGSLLLVFGSTVLFALVGFWDVRRSGLARVTYRRYRLFAIVSTLVGAGLFASWGVVTRAPWWIPAVFILGGCACLGSVMAVTPSMQRSLPRVYDTSTSSWEDISRAELRRMVRGSATSGGVALIVATAAAVAVTTTWSGVFDWLLAVMSIVFITVYAMVVPAIVETFRLNRLIREALDGDVGLARVFARVVFKNKPESLDGRQHAMAARWASLVWVLLVTQLAAQIPILLSVVLPAIFRFLSSEQRTFEVFTLGLFGVAVVLYVIFVPLTIRNIIKARRYAEQHAGLTPGTHDEPRIAR